MKNGMQGSLYLRNQATKRVPKEKVNEVLKVLSKGEDFE